MPLRGILVYPYTIPNIVGIVYPPSFKDIRSLPTRRTGQISALIVESESLMERDAVAGDKPGRGPPGYTFLRAPGEPQYPRWSSFSASGSSTPCKSHYYSVIYKVWIMLNGTHGQSLLFTSRHFQLS